MLSNAMSSAVGEVGALGTALTSEQQPGVYQERASALMWAGELLPGSPRRQEGVRHMDSQQCWVPVCVCQKPHGAASVQAGCLHKLVLVLEGLLDFKIKIIIITEHFWIQCLPVCLV